MIDTRIIAAFSIMFALVFVALGFLAILPWQAAGILAATSIGIASIILAVERKEISKKETSAQAQTKSVAGDELLWEESVLIRKRDYAFYDFSIKDDEKIVGEIHSDDYFNVYFLTPRNFDKLENGEHFNDEYGSEEVSMFKVNFAPNRSGKFYCVVENEGKEDIDVQVSLYIRKTD